MYDNGINDWKTCWFCDRRTVYIDNSSRRDDQGRQVDQEVKATQIRKIFET